MVAARRRRLRWSLPALPAPRSRLSAWGAGAIASPADCDAPAGQVAARAASTFCHCSSSRESHCEPRRPWHVGGCRWRPMNWRGCRGCRLKVAEGRAGPGGPARTSANTHDRPGTA
eukprot:11489286-Alexandrium_andersonii.AAC.1